VWVVALLFHRGPRHDARVVRIGDYESAPDAAAASWVVAGLRGFAESVLSLVPAGLEAYGRIFHPAWQWEPKTRVSWREVARANGRVAHRAMQWPSITGSRRFYQGNHQPGVWDQEPEEGSLPQELAPALVSVLARHTATPQRCWFAVWEGYGCLACGPDDAPAFDIPYRWLLLLTGPITAALTSLCAPPSWQSPSLWWPDDRAWCVQTEVDMVSTYIGGTWRCIQELIAQEELEAMIVEPADGVTWPSDTLNPPPT
jgi:hypothetical protein